MLFMARTLWASAASLDHLVGAREHRRRNFDAQRTRGRQIDDELEFGGLHHGQVGGFSALEDADCWCNPC